MKRSFLGFGVFSLSSDDTGRVGLVPFDVREVYSSLKN